MFEQPLVESELCISAGENAPFDITEIRLKSNQTPTVNLYLPHDRAAQLAPIYVATGVMKC